MFAIDLRSGKDRSRGNLLAATWGNVTVAKSMEVAAKLYIVSSGCILKVMEMKFADR